MLKPPVSSGSGVTVDVNKAYVDNELSKKATKTDLETKMVNNISVLYVDVEG